MKRFLLISLVLSLFATSTALAQKNRVSGAMSVIKIDTIKTKKVFETVDVKRGFEQEINLAYSYIDFLTNHVNLNYIAGYRFNHFLYVGVGTGLDFGCSNNYKPFVNTIKWGTYEDKGNYYHDGFEDAPVQKVAIPLYAHFKAYFMKTRWAPFLAFSAGARFSAAKKAEVFYWDEHLRTEKYGAVTGMFEILPGVSFKYNEKYAFNLQFGYATRSGYDWNSNTFKRFWYHGLTVKLGVVF